MDWGWDPINQLTRAKSVLDVLTFYHYMYIFGTLNLIKLRNMPDRQASQMFAFLPRTNKFHIFV